MSCTFHQRLISNLVRIMAIKNVALNEKISHLSRRSTKEKLLSYLSDCAKKAQSMHFTIPFDRQELADYLCVERSAMSAELGKLKKTGILDCRKNEFWLKEMWPEDTMISEGVFYTENRTNWITVFRYSASISCKAV